MKFNWRVLVALVVLVGTIFWGADSLRARSYNGTDLNFGVGNSPVTVTNPSEGSLAVQLVGAQSGTFTVASTIEGVSGRSTRVGSGRSITQLFEFALPPGVSEITVIRGADVNFVANSDTRLEALVQPLNAEGSSTTLIIVGIVILGTLFYMSRATGHHWINRFRRENTSIQDTNPTPVVAADNPNMGRDGRMYQDV
jgi:hypothetical protein